MEATAIDANTMPPRPLFSRVAGSDCLVTALKAAALATGTLLATPYLAIYDMVVLAIPVAFLVRIGLRTGFRGYELPALGSALVLIACYFTGTPTGLGATPIVSVLILGSCRFVVAA